MRLSLVIPTLNEAASIGRVITRFLGAVEAANRSLFREDPLEWEILVVDGGSSDGTAAIAEGHGARVILEARRGYGRAYRTGFASVTGEVVATLDGDATYPAEEIPTLVRRLLDGRLDFITCDRLAHLDPKAMTLEHRIGNRVLNLILGLAYHRFLRAASGGGLHDSQSGMWVFRRAILTQVSLTQDGMALSEELKLEVVLRGLRFEEVPIRYAERWGAPKLSSWRDGRRNLGFLLTKRLAIQRKGLAPPPSGVVGPTEAARRS